MYLALSSFGAVNTCLVKHYQEASDKTNTVNKIKALYNGE